MKKSIIFLLVITLIGACIPCSYADSPVVSDAVYFNGGLVVLMTDGTLRVVYPNIVTLRTDGTLISTKGEIPV